MNVILAGAISAGPLSALGIVYMLLKGPALVAVLNAGSTDTNTLTNQQWFYLCLALLALAPFAFGVLAGLVYSRVDNPQLYLGLAGHKIF